MKTDWEAAALEYTQRGMTENEWTLGYQRVLQLLGEKKNILDYGCGSGKFSRILAREGKSVIGIDPSPAMIDLARKQECSGIEYRCGHDLDFIQKDSLDGAVACFVFCGIEDAELLQLCWNVHDKLKEGAPFVVLDPHPHLLGNTYLSGSREKISGGKVKTHLNGMTTPLYDQLRMISQYVYLLDKTDFSVDLMEGRYEKDNPQYLILKGIKRKNPLFPY
jgi:SAM-dependent methyltransferase